jgi:hypothetical protein
MITKKDLEYLATKNISSKEVERQVKILNEGVDFVELVDAATPGNGITVYDSKKINYYVNYFEENKNNIKIANFVPASGAASRMFKDLVFFRNNFDPNKDTLKDFASKHNLPGLVHFFKNIKKVAFYRMLKKHFKSQDLNLKMYKGSQKYMKIAMALLDEDQLNFLNIPKGLIPFHYYKTKYRTAVSEHMVESANLITGKDRIVKLHLTVAKDKKHLFEKLVEAKRKKYESDFNVKYEVEYSFQEENTDTIMLDSNNEIYRVDGIPVLRPGGHGSLLTNLNSLKEDVVFIKNIDNVVPDFIKENTIKYRKMLGGVLLSLNNVIRSYESRLTFKDLKPETLGFVEDFLSSKIGVHFDEEFRQLGEDAKIEALLKILKRPVRVCGVVPNTGKPGGGPFWVKDKNGKVSLQIVESSQVDFSREDQAEIVKNSTHFNPVDIVCSFKDWNGNSMDLTKFVDENTSFISSKNIKGVEIKALERPGLWNGSMSDWNTVFIEVPELTFNPVKTVNDLLNPEHQTLTEIQTTA